MNITLYQTTAEQNRLNKTLNNALSLSGTLREETSVTSPSIVIEHSNPVGYNYAYIPAFGRYYYINDITSVRNGIWRLSLSVDVLMTYRSDILQADVILNAGTSPDRERYLDGDQWQATVKKFTDVLSFPQGLLDSGEYILITAGGVVGGQ